MTTAEKRSKSYPLPKPDAWKRRDNSILLDVETGRFKVHNRTRGKIRLYLGSFADDEFAIAVPTIKAVSEEVDSRIREIAREIVGDLNSVRTDYTKRKLAL